MCHNTSQDAEASSGQEEPKLRKTDGFKVRQMQRRVNLKIGRNTCQHWDKRFRSTPDNREFETAPWIAPWVRGVLTKLRP